MIVDKEIGENGAKSRDRQEGSLKSTNVLGVVGGLDALDVVQLDRPNLGRAAGHHGRVVE